jgi:RNA polymerase sigma-70 factor (ECF subfamily)
MDVAADADTELLRRIAEGDLRGAGTLLVRAHADAVYSLCRGMVRDARAAEDLSQDVFGRAFAALEEFRGEAAPRTWLLRIAKNRCIDHLRARRREPLGMDDEPDAHPADEPLAIDAILARTDVEQALAALDEGERAMMVLRFGHGLGYPELAGAFGLKEGTVRMRVSRAISKMRDAIGAPETAERPALAQGIAAPAEREESARAPKRKGVMDLLRRREVASEAGPPRPAAAMPAPRAAPAPAMPARASGSASLGAPPSPGAPPPVLRWIAPASLRHRLERAAAEREYRAG